jgi:plastocyanin
MRRALLTALLDATLLSGCGEDDSARPAATTGTITIRDLTYAPMPAVVKAGRRILARNGDDAPHALTDRAAARAFDSGTIEGGQTGSVTFRAPGTSASFCELHPFTKGTVTVTR